MNKKKIAAAAVVSSVAGTLLGMTADSAAAASTSYCLDNTRLTSISAQGGPFDGGTRISWQAVKGCAGVSLVIAGMPVASSGYVVRDPQVTTKYTVTAVLDGQTRNLGSKVAVGGDVVGYLATKSGPVARQSSTGPGDAEASAFAAPIVNSLSNAAKSSLLGKRIAIHMIPEQYALTQLPPWRDLAGTSTCDGKPATCVDDREWSTVRGVGGKLMADGSEIAMAAGVDTVRQTTRMCDIEYGHTLVHELGHALLDFAAPTKEPVIDSLLTARGPNGSYPGKDVYTRSNAEEYWAEGTAALFGIGGPRVISASWQRVLQEEYSVAWLTENDPALLEQLRSVFPYSG
ncbi:hypothetical protein ACTG9Q_15900 [Actinokineospora sp. 24-640]